MKISHPVRSNRGTAVVAAGLIAVPALLGASQPVASASASPKAPATTRGPELAVAVTDGRTAARAGDVLTYTVTVRDTGPAAASRLTITQTLSDGLALVSASDHGRASHGQVSWAAGLAAGGSRIFRVVTRVTRTTAAQLRLSAVACVTLPGSRRPAVCAAHLDRLPAAAAAQAPRPGTGPAVYALAAAAAAALGLLAAVVLRRRGLLRRWTA
jgi:uncharacterized repeat protein (TIGR01451 family)